MLSNPCCSVRIHATVVEMLSRMSDKLNRFACGMSSTPPEEEEDDAAEQPEDAMLDVPFLHHRRAPCYRSMTRHPCAEEEEEGTGRGKDEEDGEEGSAGLLGVALFTTPPPPELKGKDEETRLPCLVFPSLDGYRVFSLAERCMCDDGEVRLRMACRRRYVASPYGGKVFVTDLNWRYSSHLIDPFTGERTPLPDLPIPFSETEPMPCAADEPRARGSAVGTDDGFAWDWSPRGVMVARGDTVFFCEAGGYAWAPVHRSRCNSPMTVNHRGGFFFILEWRSLLTTVIDAETLAPSAVIRPPPNRHNIDDAYLVASTDDVLLLVRRRASDSDRKLFTQAYRARHRGASSPTWARVTDIGDRAALVTRAHGFTVGVDPNDDGSEHAVVTVRRNRVYVVVRVSTARDQLERRRVVNHKIGVVHLKNPRPPTLLPLLQGELDGRCLHGRKLGEPHWIIPSDGSPPLGSVKESKKLFGIS
ncbi:hypothetical protein E2562_000508 [Oryza meyeriana var. granulata]|uniref:KIB1-4 beta-propeller domain-containing protein n=1 Tax=Oryza meyeriana var. granulata TaxID=110450 RepID=A0A6G1CCD3_9ORYZ|nr:hypothetical protein E2562_000508 [Oryza meyeriana var. granulata]